MCSEKILKSRRLEEIRLTILNNLLLFHPESGQELAWGIRAHKADSSIDVPLGARSKCVSGHLYRLVLSTVQTDPAPVVEEAVEEGSARHQARDRCDGRDE